MDVATPELSALLHRAVDDPNVQGVILTGSTARGTATIDSDVDVYVVVRERGGWVTTHSPAIDVAICTLTELSAVPRNPNDWWSRYSFVDSRILFAREEDALQPLISAWATLTATEVDRCLETYLDGYVNFLYRSVKAHRDGRDFEQRLDAVESVNWMLWVVFAVFGRVRPYNKYLRYELRRRPLDRPGWAQLDLVGNLMRLIDSGDVAAQREIYHLVESSVRELGHGATIDAWADELTVIRGDGAVNLETAKGVPGPPGAADPSATSVLSTLFEHGDVQVTGSVQAGVERLPRRHGGWRDLRGTGLH